MLKMHRLLQDEVDDEIHTAAQGIESIDVCGDEASLSEDERRKLALLHCPFTWKPFNDANCRDVTAATENKLSNREDEGDEFTAWTTFLLNLILCYEYANKGAIDSALEKQEECHKIIEHAIESGSVAIMGIGLKHVSDSCKIFLSMKSKQLDEVTKCLSEVTEIEKMKIRDQASIWSIRAAVYLEYGAKGMKESIPFIEKSLQLDPNCGEWHFLLGKALSRVRRIEDRYGIPDQREIKALEYAVQVSDNTYYMVLLAQSYVDTARQVTWRYKKDSNYKSLCDNINRKAFEMYKRAFENCKDNPKVLARCAYGFMKLPNAFQDVELIKNSIVKSLAKDATNTFLNHSAGMFYQRQKEMDTAKYHYAQAAEGGSFGACLALLMMKQKENKSYDPVPDLERYICIFKEKSYQEQLFSLLGAFYYFEKNDFNSALTYWLKVIESNIDSNELKTLQNPWPGAPHPCNVSKTIINEIFKRLGENCNVEDRIMYEKVLSMYKKHHEALVKSVEKIFSERSNLKNYCAGEQRPFLAPSDVWHNMSRNAVGNYWKVQSHSKKRNSSK